MVGSGCRFANYIGDSASSQDNSFVLFWARDKPGWPYEQNCRRTWIITCTTECKNLPGSAASLVDRQGPPYEVSLPEKQLVFSITEIASKFSCHIRESAEAFLGTSVSSAVLAVPAYFTEAQQKDLITAADNAGLLVLQLIHKSAAVVWAHETATKAADKTAAGSNSLDVTVLIVHSGVYSVLETTSDTQLGGVFFDNLLMQPFAAEIKHKSNFDITYHAMAQAKLRNAVEVTKKMLSSSNTAPCFVESLADGLDFHDTINRKRFEMLSNIPLYAYFGRDSSSTRQGPARILKLSVDVNGQFVTLVPLGTALPLRRTLTFNNAVAGQGTPTLQCMKVIAQ